MVSERIGVVIIGRNEGERLRKCIDSVQRQSRTIVYVDSGSGDGSEAYAVSAGVDLVRLDSSVRFTAARARNVGWRRLLEIDTGLRFIQFIDGDCELMEGWLEAASRFLDENAKVAVVCGRRREADPNRNVYHRLTDREWNTPIGQTKYCGGDALMRVAALSEVGGYRDSLIAGEEPELCVRLRSAGWQVWRIDHEMTLHDIRMTAFRQWWLRGVRGGHAYAEGAALHGAFPERHWVREVRSIWFWGVILPVIAGVLAIPTQGVSIVVAVAAYLALFAKIFCVELLRSKTGIVASLQYAAMCIFVKFPQALGQIMYWVGRRRGVPQPILEYHSTKPHDGKR